MKIFLSDIELSEGSQSPKNLCVDLQRQSQTEFIIGARNAEVSDRGNGKYFVSFEMERAHGSELAAKVFALSHAAELEKKLPADLRFEMKFPREKSMVEFSMPKVSCEKIRITPMGVITLAKYEFCSQTIEGKNMQ